ncbi:T9SS type A sorting domain-containing protein [Flavobacterium sp.]|uniref:DUF7619 domain-containing protein n=1 Tax=Flavobacterium sp. TaxID=239 RepID=UPI00374DA79D
MKKILLFLLVISSYTVSSQVTNLQNCFGNTTFNLTTRNAELIGAFLPNETIVTYHLTLADATNGINAIATPTNYIQTTNPQVIYARIDHLGSITTNFFSLIQNTPVAISAVLASPLSCTSPAMVLANASGGSGSYTYSITPAGSVIQTGNQFQILAPGSFTITGTDSIGCTATSNSVAIFPSPPINAVVSVADPLCNGSTGTITVIAMGGTAPYTYSLSSPVVVGPQSSNVFPGLPTGSYIVTVTDATGCALSIMAVITQPTPLTCNATISGNTVTINATGGVAPYTFGVNGGPFQSSTVYNNLTPGMYTIQVRDAYGCTCTSTVSIPNNGFSVTLGSTLDVPVSTFFANVLGGVAPFSYQWSYNGVAISGATSQSINTQSQCGQFSVLVTDANGLLATASATAGCVSIFANNDAVTIYSSNIVTTTSTGSVLSNDFLNSVLVNSPTNNVTLTPLTIPIGFLLNPNGTISVLPGTASGTYTLSYQICQNSNLNNCTTAIATITIPQNGILLKAFVDSNGNNIQDIGEANFTQGQFGYELNNSGTINYITSSSGQFLITESNATNTYNLSYTINTAVASQYSLTTSSYSNVNALGSGITTYNFPVTELPFTDLAVYLSQSGAPPRPGFVYTDAIVYRNNGNQTIASGTVTFTNNNVVTITTISQTGTIPTATGFTYDFTNLLPGESRYIFVTMQVPVIPTVALGQLLTNSVSATIPLGDINVGNNNSNISQIIVGSYDPNDKVESHGGKIVHSTFTTNDYLTYTIQFENTGTANAENVRINDVLDAKLDETSIKMVNASHTYILNRVENNLNWNFNGIELTPTGKGFITFQVKPKAGYVINDVIPNTASIFFDFNPAIVTNTFNTEFVAALNIPEFESKEFSAYPNPTSNTITISLNNNSDNIDSVIVTDVLGKTVLTKMINDSSAKIDLSNMSKGIYLLKVKSREQEKVLKIVKE